MNKKEIVETLNDLIETSKDGQLGFAACAQHVASQDLRRLFEDRAAQCAGAAAELQELVAQYGGQPGTNGSATGALHRGWVAVRGSLAGFSDEAMLEECERGEDAALARYRAALRDEALPDSVRSIVARQQMGVQGNHDQIKRLRDTVRAG